MRKNKKNNINKTLLIIDILLVVVILATAGYLYFSHEKSMWPFENNEAGNVDNQSINQVNQDKQTETTLETVDTTETTEDQQPPIEQQVNPETTQNNSDGYVQEKTPAQYEGQTNNSEIKSKYNYEQFRIPEEEL